MFLGDVADKLLNEYGFAHSRAAEKSDLAASCVRGDEVDDLDSCFINLGFRILIREARCRFVNRRSFRSVHRAFFVNGFANDIEKSAENFVSHRHRNRCSRVDCLHSANEPVCGRKSNASDHIIADMLRHLRHNLSVAVLNFNGVQELGHMPLFKFYINNRADNLAY